MPDTKITALTALTAADPANDVLPIVDVSDTTMAASGTTKKISINNVLGCSGTATLASATITGALTAGGNSVIGTGSAQNAAANRGNLTIGGTSSAILNLSIGSGDTGYLLHDGTNISFFNRVAGGSLIFGANSTEQMRLNSTGLGVGVSPSYNLDVRAAAAVANVQSSTGTNAVSIVARNTGGSFTVGKENSVGGGSGVFGQDAYASVLWSTGAYPVVFGTNGAHRLQIDSAGNMIPIIQTTAPTLTLNGQMVFNLTSNTNLRISVRGSDGTTRTANITLA